MIDVIIVDDDVNVRRGLQKLVDWESLDARLVMACKSGQEVVDYLKAHRVDFIISDVKMPDIDGLELSKYVHKHFPGTAVVLLSAYNEFDLVQEALQYDVQKYILKPINKEKLRTLSDMVREVSEEQKQKKKLSTLMYNSDFRNVVKKAFRENDKGVLNEALSVSRQLGKTKGRLLKEYYTFLFNIMAEFARETDEEHVFEDSLLRELDGCTSEEEFTSFIIRVYDRIMNAKNAADARKEKVGVEEIKRYIDRHYCESGFSTSDIVNRFNFSVSYLSGIFKKAEGTTIVDYITDKRIQRASQLIRETNFSVTYISALVGYDNIQYFSKVFKSATNMSPTEYSNKYRNGGNEQ